VDETTQVVAASFIKVAYEGYRFSLQFDEGGKWNGYAPGLVPGWLFGRKMVRCFELLFVACWAASENVNVGCARRSWRLSNTAQDLSDRQWRDFRTSLPHMCILVALFALVSRLCQTAAALGMKGAEARYRLRLWCIAIVSLVFVIYLHGSCAIYVLLLIYANWRLSRARFGDTKTWKRCVSWDDAC